MYLCDVHPFHMKLAYNSIFKLLPENFQGQLSVSSKKTESVYICVYKTPSGFMKPLYRGVTSHTPPLWDKMEVLASSTKSHFFAKN